MKTIKTTNNTPFIDFSYRDKNVILCNDIHNISNIDDVQMECFIVILIKKGHLRIKIEKKNLQLKAGDLFSCTPRIIINNAMMSMDFNMLSFIFSPESTIKMIQDYRLNLNYSLLHSSYVVQHLTEDQVEMITGYYEMLSKKLNMPRNENTERIINHLLQSLAYECKDIFKSDEAEITENIYSSSHIIFKNFIKILKTEEKPNKSVQEYAERLNITPKYFSAICKQIAGKTASTIIAEEIVSQARYLLKDPNKSVKQIAMILGFVNQSHFGSFIRRRTGLSPQNLREKVLC